MRVVAGTARSIQLVTPEGKDTRPTTDRIKETLFNMIQGECPGAAVLDLFAGSGGLGIEALSRGAASAVFVDVSQEAAKCVTANLAKTKLADRATVIKADFESAVRRLANNGKSFDLIFLDPPYGKGFETEALTALGRNSLVKKNALIVIEESIDHDEAVFDSINAGFEFEIEKIKNYKSNRHYFLRVQ